MPAVKEDDRADLPAACLVRAVEVAGAAPLLAPGKPAMEDLARSYLAAVSFVDSQIGRVLNALDETEFGRNTIVILWSDHGWHLGEKGITGKTSLWERSTRVPLIFAGPGIQVGGRSEQPVELLDLYPTMIELSGLPARPVLEGHSLVELLRNPQTTWRCRRLRRQPEQSRCTLGALALHPLCRRFGGTVRPSQRSQRMDECGAPERLRKLYASKRFGCRRQTCRLSQAAQYACWPRRRRVDVGRHADSSDEKEP